MPPAADGTTPPTAKSKVLDQSPSPAAMSGVVSREAQSVSGVLSSADDQSPSLPSSPNNFLARAARPPTRPRPPMSAANRDLAGVSTTKLGPKTTGPGVAGET